MRGAKTALSPAASSICLHYTDTTYFVLFCIHFATKSSSHVDETFIDPAERRKMS